MEGFAELANIFKIGIAVIIGLSIIVVILIILRERKK